MRYTLHYIIKHGEQLDEGQVVGRWTLVQLDLPLTQGEIK